MREQDNELLTRVEKGAAMGDMLREWFWVPALRAARLVAGAPPIRIRFFGAAFVAFRGADGRVGVLNEACPHRGASLALAHNEDCALRCIYHGWKINASGDVVDVPNETVRPERLLGHVKARAYPVREAGGIVWIYFGSQATTPRFPDLAFTRLDPQNLVLTSSVINCNWAQALEGALDSAHVAILHQSFLKRVTTGLTARTADAAPVYEFERTPYGMKAAAIRQMGDGTRYVRITTFVMPWFALMCPNDPAVGERTALAAVPVDDTHTLQWYIRFNPRDVPSDPGFGWNITGYDPDNLTPLPGPENYWGQDREAIANGHFTGFPKHHLLEDTAVQVSMGPIAGRGGEHLTTSDAAVVELRRLLLQSVRDHQSGKPPLSTEREVPFDSIESRAGLLAQDKDWHTAL